LRMENRLYSACRRIREALIVSKRIIAAAILVATGSPCNLASARADTLDGNELHRACSTMQIALNSGFCAGFAEGATTAACPRI
jgi:hypothetical protein